MHQDHAARADALSLLAVVASAWLALELLFYVLVRHVLLPRLQPLTRPPPYPVQARKLMTKVRAPPRGPDDAALLPWQAASRLLWPSRAALFRALRGAP